jgi:hypothetical protein
MGHWNYTAGTVKPIYVVAAKAARVDLKLNGKVLGSIKASPMNSNQSLALPAGQEVADIVRWSARLEMARRQPHNAGFVHPCSLGRQVVGR